MAPLGASSPLKDDVADVSSAMADLDDLSFMSPEPNGQKRRQTDEASGKRKPNLSDLVAAPNPPLRLGKCKCVTPLHGCGDGTPIRNIVLPELLRLPYPSNVDLSPDCIKFATMGAQVVKAMWYDWLACVLCVLLGFAESDPLTMQPVKLDLEKKGWSHPFDLDTAVHSLAAIGMSGKYQWSAHVAWVNPFTRIDGNHGPIRLQRCFWLYAFNLCANG